MLLGRLDELAEGLLDADVDDVVAVVGEDDVDQVLADVVHVAAHGADHHGALARGIRLLHVRFEQRDGRLHDLGGLQHEGQLHLAAAEAVAHHLHAGEQMFVHDLECAQPARTGEVEIGLEALRFAVDDAALQPLAHRERGQFGGARVLQCRRVDTVEEIE